MEKKETNKVTKTAKMETKTTSRGEKWPSCSTDREKRHEKSYGQGGTYRQSTYRRKQLLSSQAARQISG